MLSNQYMFIKLNKIEISVKNVNIQSFLWSSIFASSNKSLYFLANFLVYKNKHSFVNIVIKQTDTSNHEKVNVFLTTKDTIELYKSLAETKSIERLMNKEKTYSAFPCPKF